MTTQNSSEVNSDATHDLSSSSDDELVECETVEIIKAPQKIIRGKKIDIIPFESLIPTNIVYLAYLNSEINLDLAFLLLPITRVVMPRERRKKTIKYPHLPDNPGAIFSLRKDGRCRGIVKGEGASMKNCVTCDMCIRDKNINTKIYKDKIHVAGAKKESHGNEAATLLINHLKKINEEFNHIKSLEITKILTTIEEFSD